MAEVQESRFSGINMKPKRETNELYCDYKCRMFWVNRLKKHYLKGMAVWTASMGTYRKQARAM